MKKASAGREQRAKYVTSLGEACHFHTGGSLITWREDGQRCREDRRSATVASSEGATSDEICLSYHRLNATQEFVWQEIHARKCHVKEMWGLIWKHESIKNYIKIQRKNSDQSLQLNWIKSTNKKRKPWRQASCISNLNGNPTSEMCCCCWIIGQLNRGSMIFLFYWRFIIL